MTTKDFLFALPQRINAAASHEQNTRFHFDIAGDNGGKYTVALTDGKCEVSEGLQGEAKCSIRAKDSDLIGVINGTINPMMAVMMGKLKISNLPEMQKYAKAFGLM